MGVQQNPTSRTQSEPRNKETEAAHKNSEHGHDSLTDSMSKYLHLPHLPKMPHRPTKEELLAAANGFWQRLKVRFKWFSIRSTRPFNADEWGAFLSWILFGHFVWILVGTTTFVSLLILMVNTVFAQETLAQKIGDYLTKAAGVTVVFESAIVPKWGDGVITFRNVFVSRRPGQTKSSVSKGSPTDAAAAAAAVTSSDPQATVDDGNYTQFDVTISEVNVTLSFSKWWNSTGLLKDVEVKGVRGIVDRTSVHWSGEKKDPLSYRHEYQPGDFEIEHFKLEDLLVTVHQPGGFRPFSVSIYSCELPQLRKQWLFYDFLSASHMSGSFDGSLFTIHPKQVHGTIAGDEKYLAENLGEPSAWKKFSRLRIDGLKIDHLNRGVEGTFGWIYEGNVDIVADVMFPAEPDESIGKVMSDFYDKMEETVTSNRYLRILDKDLGRERNDFAINNELSSPTSGHLHVAVDDSLSEHPDSPPDASAQQNTPDEPPRYLVMDLRIHLNDVRASVPMFSATPDISYVNQNLVRPIVAYINSKHTYIPISCRIVKRASDFDGSWTTFDCGLMDDMSAEVYSAFARDVEDQHSRVKRLKKVGFWAVSVALQALLVGVAGDLIT
ncbi:mitochondrial distribution and morphology protein family 31/32 [Cryphonectria parasitica EP155]|uniref:Mitochondrial distribution and morphology protein family 31/32 n=1 Tax=Cryphonectria parasitica (strain ATCC 38755 / EP155) TaxID=660469 RepID=A0A9P5CQI5_CRYP1|nr:mitochondrial distribution and morphology protein family 31/32 [Cryphonectria parasitica EP155]KAF3767268.1 mitochondrial distribution and morphology protein family 31/32 [Cryphonectria parasitica EP155]